MAPWLVRKGHRLSVTRLYRQEPLPGPDAFDALIVMGGPMGVHDDERHPWLAGEKRMIEAAMADSKIVLGICLGAQLMAQAAGAAVTRNACREIGWFPVTRADRLQDSVLRDVLPPVFDAFHWHGDTFDLPPGAVPVGSSRACRRQGFLLDNRMLGLQFHLESTSSSVAALIQNCSAELDDTPYVQAPSAMLDKPQRFHRINTLMANVLDALFDCGT